MPDSTAQITDAQLVAELENSFIAPAQKAELQKLIPKMSDAERAELLRIILRSREEKKKADKAYGETLTGLEKEYKDTIKKEDTGFRHGLEKMEKDESVTRLQAIQAELATISAPTPISQLQSRNSKGHAFRNLFLALLFLGLLAGGALYLLNTL